MIGRTERGFDFLGYHFKSGELSVAGYTIERFKKRIARLYEQDADINRIGQYIKKWVQWVNAGIDKLSPQFLHYMNYSANCLQNNCGCVVSCNYTCHISPGLCYTALCKE